MALTGLASVSSTVAGKAASAADVSATPLHTTTSAGHALLATEQRSQSALPRKLLQVICN